MERRTRKQKGLIGKLAIVLCIVMMFAGFGTDVINAKAADILATVHGTVMSGTTSDMIQLNSNGVIMLIKIDSGTDMSDCKVLVPGFNIGVSVYRGNDAYLHAARVTTDLQTEGVALDASTKTTVFGKILESSTTNILNLSTSTGEMSIKYNASTDTSGCKLLVAGRSVYVTIARGSDAYQHALVISDSTSAPGTPGNSTSQTADYTVVSNTSGNPTVITGTVKSTTNNQYIYLSTSAGDITIKADNALDTSSGRAMITGKTVTAYVYRGADAYMHATKVIGNSEYSDSASLDYNTTYTVSGTVNKNTTENILVFDTTAGQMQIKLDSSTGYSNCLYLYEGRPITVTCSRGSDAYLHATIITGN